MGDWALERSGLWRHAVLMGHLERGPAGYELPEPGYGQLLGLEEAQPLPGA